MCLDYFITSRISASAIEGTQIDEEEMKVMGRPAWLLGQRRRKVAPVLKGKGHPLDNFRDLARVVAIGNGDFLHPEWFHPHLGGFGHRCSCN